NGELWVPIQGEKLQNQDLYSAINANLKKATYNLYSINDLNTKNIYLFENEGNIVAVIPVKKFNPGNTMYAQAEAAGFSQTRDFRWQPVHLILTAHNFSQLTYAKRNFDTYFLMFIKERWDEILTAIEGKKAVSSGATTVSQPVKSATAAIAVSSKGEVQSAKQSEKLNPD